MWTICHQPHCPRLLIVAQDATDAKEAHRARAKAARVAEWERLARIALAARQQQTAAQDARAALREAMREAMRDAHPDKPGGSHEAFLRAHAAWRAARLV